jgi:hypothetical protein
MNKDEALQLALEAFLHKAGITIDKLGSVDSDDWVGYPKLQKFAELIIRECASIAGKAEYNDTWAEPVEDTIKKHFGVE